MQDGGNTCVNGFFINVEQRSPWDQPWEMNGLATFQDYSFEKPTQLCFNVEFFLSVSAHVKITSTIRYTYLDWSVNKYKDFGAPRAPLPRTCRLTMPGTYFILFSRILTRWNFKFWACCITLFPDILNRWGTTKSCGNLTKNGRGVKHIELLSGWCHEITATLDSEKPLEVHHTVSKSC